MADAATRQDTGDFTMMFRVNGAAVYARGGSMIPMDLLNGRLSAEVRTETHFLRLSVSHENTIICQDRLWTRDIR